MNLNVQQKKKEEYDRFIKERDTQNRSNWPIVNWMNSILLPNSPESEIGQKEIHMFLLLVVSFFLNYFISKCVCEGGVSVQFPGPGSANWSICWIILE